MKKIDTLTRIFLASSLTLWVLTGCNKTESAAEKAIAPKSESGAKHETEKITESAKKHRADSQVKDSTNEHKEENRLKLTPEELKTAGIQVEAVKEQQLSAQLTVTATIHPNQDKIAHISPRVSGRIIKVNANLGDRVKDGQALAMLDSIELGEAHSAYVQVLTQQKVAQADLDRAEQLNADQIIPHKDYLRAKAGYEQARSLVRAAKDKLRLLEVAPESKHVDRTVSVFPLNAPFTGVVIEKHAILGELAQPDKSLFTIGDLSVLWIEANLFEQDLAKVNVGAETVVTVTAYPDQSFRGKVTYISSTVDKESRSVQARIEVPNLDGRLKPEMFATASIATAATANAITLPQEAVLLVNGQPTAFVEEAGEYEPRPVELGAKLSGRVAIKGGLKEGERVVIAGAYALKARLLKSQIGDEH